MITGNDILGLGFKPGPIIKLMLEEARGLEAAGEEKASILAALKARVPQEIPKIRLREGGMRCAEAIRIETPEEERNIASVREKMGELLRTPVVIGGAVMPDTCVAGMETATIPVGGCIAVKNAMIPASHSADLCCSMFATFFKSDLETGELMDHLQRSTRFGAGGRSPSDYVAHPVLDEPVWENPFLCGLKSYAERHIADQGDGNHFAYLGQYSPGPETKATLKAAQYETLSEELGHSMKVLVTHHGSRGLGAQVYKRGIECAVEMTERIATGIPKAAAWIPYDSPEGKNYWEAIQYVSRWTRANHEAIHRIFSEKAGFTQRASFGNAHNFIWKRGDIFLHGKGATPAWKDATGRPLLGLIPLNMSADILIVLGADNPEFLSFAPHGAGRNQSRTETIKPFKDSRGIMPGKVAEAIAAATTGLDIRWFSGKPDISESPLGYKNAESVRAQIEHFGLAKIVAKIRPLGCIMAGESDPFWKKKKKA